MPPLKYTTISLDAFNETLSRYASIVPEKLQDLDTVRYQTIPNQFARRKGAPVLSKDKVEQLVEWKLKHGTFRPKLLQLVQSNDADTVTKTTENAFRMVVPYNIKATDRTDTEPGLSGDVLKALKALTALKGIGPATASLLLSVAVPERVPFFSDELFRWCMWDEAGSPNGWKRAIKYNAKEYEEVVKRVDQLVKRLGIRAVDAEQVAYVLGKDGADVGADAGEEEDVQAGDKNDEGHSETEAEAETKKAKKQKQGTKRKATDSKTPTEGSRKSTRTTR